MNDRAQEPAEETGAVYGIEYWLTKEEEPKGESMPSLFEGVLPAALSKTMKMVSADGTTWIQKVKKINDEGVKKIRVVIEAPESDADVWANANLIKALESFKTPKQIVEEVDQVE